jgi:mannosyltransferase OCH1-like enzyme
MKINKTIHYCWFGGNPLPPLAKKCIASWKKFLPEYEIKEWNESNFDVNIIPYTAQAYARKKYAFVSDYARFWILYKYGGVYFDTDVEVIKPMEDIIKNGPFMGCERDGTGEPRQNVSVAPGLGIAVNPGLGIYSEVLESYKNDDFIKNDGKLNTTTIVDRTTDILKQHGLKNIAGIQNVAELMIYPTEFFCPKSFETGKLNITKNTRTIHWYDASWQPPYKKLYIAFMRIIPKRLRSRIQQMNNKRKAKS